MNHVYPHQVIQMNRQEMLHVNAANMHHQDQCLKCEACKTFHKYGFLNCGHVIPHVYVPANVGNIGQDNLIRYPWIINGRETQMIWETGTSLVGVTKELIAESDYTGEYVTCQTFGGTKEITHWLG